jgi:hypothetical protein
MKSKSQLWTAVTSLKAEVFVSSPATKGWTRENAWRDYIYPVRATMYKGIDLCQLKTSPSRGSVVLPHSQDPHSTAAQSSYLRTVGGNTNTARANASNSNITRHCGTLPLRRLHHWPTPHATEHQHTAGLPSQLPIGITEPTSAAENRDGRGDESQGGVAIFCVRSRMAFAPTCEVSDLSSHG